MKLNHIYLINLDSEVTRILGPFTKPEDKDKPENSFGIIQPSGIIVDKKSGYVFISSRGNKRIEILNKNFVYEASHERKTAAKFDPVGLAISNDTLYVANNSYRNILTFRFKHWRVNDEREDYSFGFINIFSCFGSIHLNKHHNNKNFYPFKNVFEFVFFFLDFLYIRARFFVLK